MTVSETSRRKSSNPALARKMRGEAFTTGGSATIQLALQVFEVYHEGVRLLTGKSEQKVCSV
jgi:hypothetical protein